MSYRDIAGEKNVAASQYVKEEKYWLNKLSGELKVSRFPRDCEGTPPEERRMETAAFQLSGEVFKKLMWLSNESMPRLHMILVTAVLALLDKYTFNGSSDAIVGAPVYKQKIKGEFINTLLILRNQLSSHMTFKELLVRIKQTITEAVENQNYPMELLPERLNISDPGTGLQLADILVLLENIHDKSYIENIRPQPNILFSFLLPPAGESIDGRLEYNASLYKKTTGEGMVRHLNTLLQTALVNPDLPLHDIEILSDKEKKQLLVDFNDTNAGYPGDKTIHRLFAEQAERTPDAVAVVGRGNHEGLEDAVDISYKELDKKSDQLAYLLREKGVFPGAIAGLLMEPSLEMISGILAVLKAGGAYLPIDPDHPGTRVSSVLEDCRPPVLLTRGNVIKNHSFTRLQGLHSMGGEPLVTAPCPQMMTLDELPFPDRSLVDYEKYSRYIGQAMVKNCIALQATRGCPYQCAYCHKIWPGKQAVRSAENLFAEVKLYYDRGIRRFAIIDDIFNLNIENSSKFFRMIIQNRMDLQLFFPNGLRGDILTEEYIDLMVEAGTVDVALALETASPRLQKLIKKNLNLEKLRRNLEYFQQKYPNVILELFTMHGFPTESEEEAMMTLDFIKSMKWLHFPYVHILKIYPNTDMAELAVANGISKEAIAVSANLAYHELPETLPFDKSFTLNYQATFLNEYFLSRERLLHVLPYQLNVLAEDELVEKYDSYLPAEIKSMDKLLEFLEIPREQLGTDTINIATRNSRANKKFYGGSRGAVFQKSPPFRPSAPRTLRRTLKILFLDLSQFFSHEESMLYDVVEPPLGLMYILTYLNDKFGDKIIGRIAKSRIDFDNYGELKVLLEEFGPDVIGMRTLTFYKDFFHQTAAMIRQWGIDAPILAGGPYATSDYNTMLHDRNINLAVLGEGEVTAAQLMGKMLENENKLPGIEELKSIPGIAFMPGAEKAVDIVFTDQLSLSLAKHVSAGVKPVDPAYVIFTSGSTGKPKGVMIEHRNVVRLMFNDHFLFDFTHRDTWTMFHSYSFDFSVWEMYGALLYGGKLILISRSLARDTEKYLERLKKEAVTVLNQTPSAFYSLMEVESADDAPGRELRLRYVIFGGEALNPFKLKAWQQRYPETRLINMFGITETTVHVTFKEITSREVENSLSNIGKPLPTLSAYVMDTRRQLLPPGVPGELYVGGEGVGRGYLNRPELTAEKFIFYHEGHEEVQRVNMSYSSYMSHFSPLYKTGDLVRFLENGDMQYLGRIDHQVQIRGYRIELGEIENRLLKYRHINDALVAAKAAPDDRTKEDYLCAYIVSDIEVEELREYLSRFLPAYMIPAYFIRMKRIPLTPNGKVDVKALPEPAAGVGDRYAAPGDEVEKKLVEIWAEVLYGKEAPGAEGTIGIHDNFFELGGHSLKATTLVSKIHKAFDVKVPLAEFFRSPFIAELALHIKNAVKETHIPIIPTEKREYYPLSSAQKRLYFVQQREPESTGYNTPYVFILEGVLDRKRLEESFNEMVRRHDSFRTSFPLVEGKPLQRIHPPEEVKFAIDYYECGSSPETEKIIRGFRRPFPLDQPPLLRVGLIKKQEHEHIFMMDSHHIITDGVSMEIFTTELMNLYGGRELPPLKLQYKDYSSWMEMIGKNQPEIPEKQENFWLKEFASEVRVLNIPTDYARPARLSFAGDDLTFELGEAETRDLSALVLKEGVTLFTMLLALYTLLLAKLSGQEDIVVGTAVTGRGHTDLEHIIGMFINTLALRNYPENSKTFREFLAEVGKRTPQAFDNQDYPFENLVEKVMAKRDPARNPLFDVVFELHNLDTTEVRVPGLTLKPYPYTYETSKFDLALNSTEANGKILFYLTYNRKLFKHETIEKFVRYFKKIITLILEDPDRKLSSVDVASREKQQTMQSRFNEDLENE